MKFKELEAILGTQNESDWRRHPNGGGWVHKDALAEAIDKEIKAITQKLNDRLETAKGSIEALKLELKTAKDEARHMLRKAKNEEKERTKQLETELQHRDAETKALARRYDDVTKQLERTRKELAEALETRVDGGMRRK